MELLLEGQKRFLTGEAGTGKSFLLNQFVTKVKDKMSCWLLTGIAALNINRATLHRTFHLATVLDLHKNLQKINFRRREECDILIIDEIPMCRLDVLKGAKKHLKADRKDSNYCVGDSCNSLRPSRKERELTRLPRKENLCLWESDLWKDLTL